MNELTGKASIKIYLTEGGKVPCVSSIPHLKKRNPIDSAALEELILNSGDSEPPKNSGKKRGGSRPNFLCYSDLILQEELRVTDDVNKFAQSMEDQLSGELTRKKIQEGQEDARPLQWRANQTREAKEIREDPGAKQPGYNTMGTFYVETVVFGVL